MLSFLLLFVCAQGFVSSYTHKDVKWTDLWLPGVPASSLREGLRKSFGIVECQKSPDTPASRGNILSEFRAAPHGGWSGKGFQRVNSRLSNGGAQKYVGFRKKADGPDMAFRKLKAGTYKLAGWVKLESNVSESSWIHNSIRFPGQKVTDGQVIASGMAKTSCWTKLQGGFTIDSESDVTLHLGGVSVASNVFIASYSMQRVSVDTWRQEQDQRIDKMRKRTVNIRVRNSQGQPVGAYLKVDQIRPDFPFGGSSSGAISVDRVYQRWFKNRFTWTVFEDEAKWYYTEYLAFGKYNYGDADAMTDVFLNMGVQIRGHTVVWDGKDYQPWWVHNLNQTRLRQAVNSRIQGVMERYKGKFPQWDVVNEPLHGQFFEEKLQDPNFSADMFRQAKSIDPNVQTALNDYNVIEYYNDSKSTPQKFINMVNAIEANGGVVDIFGAESHFSSQVNALSIKSKLDQLALGGKPIWITELTVDEKNPEIQADKFEIVMREAFSHPAVEGIVLWAPGRPNCTVTPWNYANTATCSWAPTTCLGDSFFNERPQGKRYLSLLQEWSTHRAVLLKESGNFRFRGFFGTYKVTVVHEGVSYENVMQVPKGLDAYDYTFSLPI